MGCGDEMRRIVAAAAGMDPRDMRELRESAQWMSPSESAAGSKTAVGLAGSPIGMLAEKRGWSRLSWGLYISDVDFVLVNCTCEEKGKSPWKKSGFGLETNKIYQLGMEVNK